jgi:KaiC/GvpD/RAD55 family RecA-like ATPase
MTNFEGVMLDLLLIMLRMIEDMRPNPHDLNVIRVQIEALQQMRVEDQNAKNND